MQREKRLAEMIREPPMQLSRLLFPLQTGRDGAPIAIPALCFSFCVLRATFLSRQLFGTHHCQQQ